MRRCPGELLAIRAWPGRISLGRPPCLARAGELHLISSWTVTETSTGALLPVDDPVSLRREVPDSQPKVFPEHQHWTPQQHLNANLYEILRHPRHETV